MQNPRFATRSFRCLAVLARMLAAAFIGFSSEVALANQNTPDSPAKPIPTEPTPPAPAKLSQDVESAKVEAKVAVEPVVGLKSNESTVVAKPKSEVVSPKKPMSNAQPVTGKLEAPVGPSVWYGYQTLIGDAVSLALLFNTNGSSQGTSTMGFVGYVFAGPAIHLVHQEGWSALGSLGMRVGFPLVGVGVGVAMGDNSFGSAIVAALLALSGSVAAIVLDASVLAYEHPTEAHEMAGLFSVQPLIVERQGQTIYGLAGTF